LGRRSKSVRREPNFDVGVPNRELRAEPQDRLAGTDDDERRVTKRARARGRAAKPAPQKSSKKTPEKKRRGRQSVLGRTIYWGVVLTLWGAIAGIALIAWVGAHLPSIQSLEVPKRPPSIQIAGSDGRILAVRGDSGVSAKVKDLPRHVPQAFIAIEDRRFHSHFGVDPLGIARAAFANVMHRGVSQGGSTITQQLAKNLFLSGERTAPRKVQEFAITLMLEATLSKRRILEIYLNHVEWGEGRFGAQAAARHYFKADAADLGTWQAARLAVMLPAPKRFEKRPGSAYVQGRAATVAARMAGVQPP
jgi:penicillin-binding protein 1A